MLFKIKLNPHVCSMCGALGKVNTVLLSPSPCICNSRHSGLCLVLLNPFPYIRDTGLSGLRKSPERLSQLKGGQFFISNILL